MVCSKLCKKFSFGNKSYINGSKNCVLCDLFIITESMSCACCGNELIACDENNDKHRKIEIHNKIKGFKTKVTVV